MNIKNFACSLAMLTIASFAFAEEEEHGHFDIYLARPTVGTQTVSGGIDVLDGDIFPGERVFESEMGEDGLNGIYLSIEPGFNNPGTGGSQAPGAVAPNPGDTVTVAEVSLEVEGVVADLFFWNGMGSVSFSPAVGVDFGVSDPTDPAAGDGSFDDHPFLTLDDLDANAGTFPTPGIYLGSFTAALTGLDPTDQLYLVMGTEGLVPTDAELEALIEMAVEYVEANVVVPEPGAILLAAMGASLVVLRRKN